MENNSQLTKQENQITHGEDASSKEFRLKCQVFIQNLNKLPSQESIDQTADKKAFTVLISHIEMLLDEYFFGLWETENFKWSTIANEVVGSIDLVFIHPVTGMRMRRTGAAAIQIMVDKVPDGVNGVEKNRWHLNTDNKKPNALDMGFPKLKSECLKNAAQSLGKMFGRDLNRLKSDNFQGLIKNQWTIDPNANPQNTVNGTAHN